jgi:uncharacterized cupredoxin-like copper-binding protein
MRGRRFLGMLVAASVLAIAGCGGAKPVRLDVTVREFGFGPSELRVQANQPVELHLKNEGQLQHDWTVEGMPASATHAHDTGHHDMSTMPADALHTMAEHGTTSRVAFTPTKAGRYTFFCSVAGHREAGMQGTIVVE